MTTTRNTHETTPTTTSDGPRNGPLVTITTASESTMLERYELRSVREQARAARHFWALAIADRIDAHDGHGRVVVEPLLVRYRAAKEAEIDARHAVEYS